GKAIRTRHMQGWVDEVIDDLDALTRRVRRAVEDDDVVSIAFHGNVVDVWEKLDAEGIEIDLGSDQTSLHNPWSGGYYPVGISFEHANRMMPDDPARFQEEVRKSLRRHAAAINRHAARGMYFFDYGNAFLLEASRAGANVVAEDGQRFRYPSYVED